MDATSPVERLGNQRPGKQYKMDRVNAMPASPGFSPQTDDVGFTVQSTREHGQLRLALRGELDIATAPQFESALTTAAAQDVPLIVDCTDLTFIDANGLGLLMRAQAAGPAVVVNLQGICARVAQVAGVKFGADSSPSAPRTVDGDIAAESSSVRADLAADRDRAADERDDVARNRDQIADLREVAADTRRDALQAAASPTAAHLLADLASDDDLAAGSRAARALDDSLRRESAWAAASTPDDWEAEKHDFVADDREVRADNRERLADDRNALSDLRDQHLRDLSSAVSSAAGSGSGAILDAQAPALNAERQQAALERAVHASSRERANKERLASRHSRPLANEFLAIARAISRSDDHDIAVPDVVDAAQRLFDNCDGASITRREGNAFATAATTGELACVGDEAQYAAEEGPCLHALVTNELTQTDDLTADERWPTLALTARSTRVRSVLSSPVPDLNSAGASASLNQYSVTPAAFTEDDAETALLLAAHVAGLATLSGATQVATARAQQLDEAVATRDVIGQAKGILMERERITADQAFDILRRISQRMNRKLRDVADELTATGEVSAR